MKVLLIATVQSHICQFHKPLVAMLHACGAEVHVAARNNLTEKNGMQLDFVDSVFDIPFQRSPFSPQNLRAYRQLEALIDAGGYDVIHCNTPVGGVLGRLAARSARKKGTKVLYTAHGFHFYKGAPKKNWLLWYPVEKLMSRFCDVVITITEEDYALAKAKLHCRAEHIHGVGVYTQRYHPVSADEALRLRSAEGIAADEFAILCVGELNANKNQRTLIAATAMLKDYCPKLKILLAGNGAKQSELEAQIKTLGLTDKVRLLGYRTDLEAITPCCDLIVSCSHREGLPLNILEAMLCQKPVVASVNRGHKELVTNAITGFLVPPDEALDYAKKILSLYENPKFAAVMGKMGYKKADPYTAEAVYRELQQIYSSL